MTKNDSGKHSEQLTLILIRGLPGSGKSTLAKTMHAIHLEADMFFVNREGVYIYQAEKIKEAHLWCQSECESLLKKQLNVVVANTFVKKWEMKVYRDQAKKYKAKLVIKTCTGTYPNIHGVPAETVQRMKKQWQV